jgi:hypothetical protein
MIDSTIKAAAVASLKSGEMRVAEVADLTGQSQLVATWCPGALEARREWCRQRWKDAAKGVGNAVALRLAVNGSASVHAETTKVKSMSRSDIKKLADDLCANLHQKGAKDSWD